MEKIEDFLKSLFSLLQVTRLYSLEHPSFKKALDRAYIDLKGILEERPELIIGIIGEEIAFEKEIFFDLSKTLSPIILYLKDKGIEKMIFKRDLEEEELAKFVLFLITPKENLILNPEGYFVKEGIRNIIVGKIGEEALNLSKHIPRIYKNSNELISHTLTGILENAAIDNLAIRFTIGNIMDNLLSHYQEFLKLTTIKRYDLTTYSHLLNVCILSMYFTYKLGFSKKDILDVGISAIFHDIGKLYISRKILGKKGLLSDEEFTQVKSHTILGAEILLRYIDTLGILPSVIAFEHHLKYNLSGYPKISFAQKPHIASLIVSICDVYDALFQRRSYKYDYSPDIIYDTMMKEKGTTFEPGLLGNFFKIMGIWPIGSVVELSDGRIARVLEQNQDAIFLPMVEVIYPDDKKEIIDLKEKDIKISHFINPLKEKRDYLI
jgi:HD-GYP domain-containing protein (c-di-GMP phosphodiesterase class II)